MKKRKRKLKKSLCGTNSSIDCHYKSKCIDIIQCKNRCKPSPQKSFLPGGYVTATVVVVVVAGVVVVVAGAVVAVADKTLKTHKQ